MTLNALIQIIGRQAIKNKLVNWFGGGANVYDINNNEVRDYALLFFSPTGTHTSTTNYTTYSVTMFYMDRLSDDNSNDIQIFSAGIEVLKRIVKDIENLDDVLSVSDEINLNNFTETEKMTDRVAGAYATFDITVANDNC